MTFWLSKPFTKACSLAFGMGQYVINFINNETQKLKNCHDKVFAKARCPPFGI